MNQVAFCRVPQRSLAVGLQNLGNNRKTGKYKRTVTVTKPLTYEQYLKPQYVGRLKTLILSARQVHHSINTTNLQGMGHEHHGDNHAANALLEDLFVRKFVKGVFWRSHIPEKGVAVIRRLNEIEVITTVTIPHNPLTMPLIEPAGDITDKSPRFDNKKAKGALGDYYFKAGFIETILSHQLKRNVTCTVKFAYRSEVHSVYV